MPQAVWTGTISFGLVSVRVKLYPATRKKDVRFREIDRLTGQRVHHQRVRPEPLPFEPALDEVVWPEQPAAGRAESAARALSQVPELASPESSLAEPIPSAARDVTADELVKGYEVSPGRYVTVSREELQELAPERSRSIDVEQFVESSALDPIYYETSYYVVPAPDHARSFGLLLDAMHQTGKVGIAWMVLRKKRHLAALRPHGDLMLLTTLLHADEVLPATGLAPVPPVGLSRKERDMAALLVNTLSGPFEPERFRDEYRDRLTRLIEGRAPSAQPAPQPVGSAAVQDLMAALKASVEAARLKKQKPARKPAPARRRGPTQARAVPAGPKRAS
jgi:DNA end-binding protein Ku